MRIIRIKRFKNRGNTLIISLITLQNNTLFNTIIIIIKKKIDTTKNKKRILLIRQRYTSL